MTPDANGWMPIETAPKNGDLLLLSAGYPHAGYIHPPCKVGGWWQDKWHIFGGSWVPKFWQPLPKPPVQP